MRIRKTANYAVITGDVVKSTRLTAVNRKKLHRQLSKTGTELKRVFKQSVPLQVDIFRGDSWQLLVTDPVQSLRVGLYFRAHLRSSLDTMRIDTRLSIGVGTIDFLPGDQISEGDGQAFQRSGRGLEEMGKDGGITFHLPDDTIDPETVQVVMYLLSHTVSRWSDKQALAMTGALRNWNQQKIAKTCWSEPITQQAVAQHLNRAGWDSIEQTLNWIEHRLEGV